MNDWKGTKLWKRISTLEGTEAAEAVQGLLVTWMPRIHGVLAAATGPTNFTLHDADHSFRVAEWMAEIIPGEVLKQLCPYELALLLLSAYLHDIGMTPEQGKVDRHWKHLVYGVPTELKQPWLSEKEAGELQAWLDEARPGVTPPLTTDGSVAEATVQLADELIAHYCRHRHNDWSKEWTRLNLTDVSLSGYERWVDDLVQLCCSHHEGYDELKQSRFDVAPIGRTWTVHHRYLACVLRVADVLDVDPERTPEVIFRHRSIDRESVLYWRKDHEMWLRRAGSTLFLIANPERAVVERAIRATAEGILHELQTCARLSREQPFDRWSVDLPLPYRWEFPENLVPKVSPYNDAYQYIEGAFRPNTEKLLELLSGTQLYDNPLAAVRELIQNAFDAVQEKIARQRLGQPQPNAPALMERLAHLHRVALYLEEKDGRTWLTCSDTGVGMTRHIIENYLLVSGSSQRREIIELERKCTEAGVRLGRTAQFGIGVLSYFMIADRVEICTRRNSGTSEEEPTGWVFTTDGVGSFGELRKDPSAKGGAKVSLRLRLLENRPAFFSKLADYLKEILTHLPCSFELRASPDAPSLCLEPGWNPPLGVLTEMLVSQMELMGMTSRRPLSLRSEREAHERWRTELELVKEEVRACVEWQSREGELKDRLGRYRVCVPIFSLPGGRCAAFMRTVAGDSSRFRKTGAYHAFAPVFRRRTADSGIATEFGAVGPSVSYRYSLEASFEDRRAGTTNVSRQRFSPTPLGQAALDQLVETTRDWEAALLGEGKAGFRDLNRVFCAGVPMAERSRWLVEDTNAGECFRWADLPDPAISFPKRVQEVSWQGHSVHVIPNVRLWSLDVMNTTFPWKNTITGTFPGVNFEATHRKPSRLVLLPGRHLALTYLWAGRAAEKETSGIAICRFPPKWNLLWGVSVGIGPALLNESLSASDLLRNDRYELLARWPNANEFYALRSEVTKSREDARLFILALLRRDQWDLWKRLREIDPDSMQQIWGLVFGRKARTAKAGWWRQWRPSADRDKGELRLWSMDGTESIAGDDPRIFEVLPEPGEAWRLTAPESQKRSRLRHRSEVA